MNWLLVAVFCLLAYLIGAIPFSWLVVRWLKGVDLRSVGSGNLGSTNAMRVLGAPLGLSVQALDIVKGWAPVFFFGGILASRGVPAAQYAAIAVGLAAVVGHMFPVYLKFRGGKGVNTSVGVFLALAPTAILVALAVGVAVIALTRYVSLGSITGAAVFPFAVWYVYGRHTPLMVVSIVVALLVIVLHRSNIRRLLNGTESRLGRKRED